MIKRITKEITREWLPDMIGLVALISLAVIILYCTNEIINSLR